MRLLFFGDIVGKIGRQALLQALPKLKSKHRADLCLANAENAAHGSDLSRDTANELLKGGLDGLSMGDHSFTRKNSAEIYGWENVCRPANLPPGLPGSGWRLIRSGKESVLFINLLGRVFMRNNYDCPFRTLEAILANHSLQDNKASAIIVDIHGECTAEKAAISLHFDGQVSAFCGTHTHVQTNDIGISAKGSAFITDVGMCGAKGQCLGIDKENIIKSFLEQVKYKHVIPESGPAIVSGVILEINNGKSEKAESFTEDLRII
jgi:metallophosphoesterase (TIGR00282 family)